MERTCPAGMEKTVPAARKCYLNQSRKQIEDYIDELALVKKARLIYAILINVKLNLNVSEDFLN